MTVQTGPLIDVAPEKPKPAGTTACAMVLVDFSPDDYVLWTSNPHSLDKPRQILARAPYFAPTGWKDGDIDWLMGLGAPSKSLGEAAKDVNEVKEGFNALADKETPKTDQEAGLKSSEVPKDEGPGPFLFRAFVAARDAYLDANEDFYDSLEDRGLAWHQEEYDRDVLPKSKAALEARWDMIRYYCQVEGIKVPPEQETAVAYAGELYRGYP